MDHCPHKCGSKEIMWLKSEWSSLESDELSPSRTYGPNVNIQFWGEKPKCETVTGRKTKAQPTNPGFMNKVIYGNSKEDLHSINHRFAKAPIMGDIMEVTNIRHLHHPQYEYFLQLRGKMAWNFTIGSISAAMLIGNTLSRRNRRLLEACLFVRNIYYLRRNHNLKIHLACLHCCGV
jgi:hypothetical protein